MDGGAVLSVGGMLLFLFPPWGRVDGCAQRREGFLRTANQLAKPLPALPEEGISCVFVSG